MSSNFGWKESWKNKAEFRRGVIRVRGESLARGSSHQVWNKWYLYVL